MSKADVSSVSSSLTLYSRLYVELVKVSNLTICILGIIGPNGTTKSPPTGYSVKSLE